MMQLGISTVYVHGGHLVHVTWTINIHLGSLFAKDPHEIWFRLTNQLFEKKNFVNGGISLVAF